MAAILNLPFAREQAAKLTRGTAFHADCIEPQPVKIPANLKALPDLSAMVIEYGKLMSVRSDDAFFGPIQEEIERLQGCEYDLGEVLEASDSVLLFLSRPDVQKLMDSNAAEQVARFSLACGEARKS